MAKRKSKKSEPAEEQTAAELRDEINAELGYEAVRVASHDAVNLPRCPTGSLKLDRFLGGGYKFGRMIERFGPPSSGKTTNCYMGMAQAVNMIKSMEDGTLIPDPEAGMTPWFMEKLPGMRVAFVDIEKTWDPFYANQVSGIDLDYVDHVTPDVGDSVIDAVEMLLATGRYLYIACDSIAAIVPQREAEKQAKDKTMGELAQLMSRGLRKITRVNEITIIDWMNQQREKIGVMFGSPVTTPGGKAMEFYASYRFHTVRGAKVERKIDGEMVEVGHEMKIVCRKDKVGKIDEFGNATNVNGKSVILNYFTNAPGIVMADELKDIAFELGYVEGSHSAQLTLPAVGDFKKVEMKKRGKVWLDEAFMDEELQQHMLELLKEKDPVAA